MKSDEVEGRSRVHGFGWDFAREQANDKAKLLEGFRVELGRQQAPAASGGGKAGHGDNGTGARNLGLLPERAPDDARGVEKLTSMVSSKLQQQISPATSLGDTTEIKIARGKRENWP